MTTKVKQHIAAVFIAALMMVGIAHAQSPPKADTENVFALADLQDLVFKYHPVVKQAALLTDAAKANVLQSLGYFDPKIKADFGRKLFGNTEYYNNWGSELKIPLYVAGADLKIGYDRNVGTYTNPETRTGLDGLTAVGLSIPLGQGLLIDARRNTLWQAKAMVAYAEADKVKQINSVWYDAVKNYWEWYYKYQEYILLKEGVELAQKRFIAVRNQTLIGDKPPIDSVEASITVQDREIQLAKSAIELQNAKLLLSNNLWNEQGVPLELPQNAIPQRVGDKVILPGNAILDSLVAQAKDQHPELVKLRAKGTQLDIERRYRQEVMKPKINIMGALISSRRDFNTYVPDYYDFNWRNYKVGLEFEFPLFLRKERGKLREVKIKQQQLGYDLQQSGREINNNILGSYNSLNAYRSQLGIQVQSINNQQILLTGELQKFDLGESTLFLINSRESKLLDMKIKRESMIAGYQKTLAELYYKAGTRQNL
ncbi:TolC family protein [Mucilaginibacter achroorhodeus]|uniref:TolC family protein n=1 Tax=Mucilaginibacter achroorhodeus TaxID=2599294 RepID=A0A563U3W5_9SPHI|nr:MULTISPECIES: TolC family protein [Mucilaginibacter]QXV64501.1 TolC family protein [Mucilaginibacter sp. 21P]TWR26012.1 TolC family protein [Mucilaginibacter achroorhodeus]